MKTSIVLSAAAAGVGMLLAVPRARAQTITNPSFEANGDFVNFPGSVLYNSPITGWTASDPAVVGVNISTGPFAVNSGAIPNGTHVAYLQSTGTATTLSTTITGLTAGNHYRVKFRANCRFGYDNPVATCRINGGPAVPFTASPSVGGLNDYYFVTMIFTATATTAPMEISNAGGPDSTLLVDDFSISAATVIQVLNTNDSGAGSLRASLATAAGTPAFNVITFAAALNGATITLTSGQLDVIDAGGLAIDASALPSGITLNGGAAPNRIFNINAGSIVEMRRFTLTSGESAGFGGAVLNQGTLAMAQCTLTGNTAARGGAINNDTMAFLGLSQCTLTGNTATVPGSEGGAIRSAGTVALTHCTVSANTSTSFGGGITNYGKLTLNNCIVAANTANILATADVDNFGGAVTRVGANIVMNQLNNNNGGNIATSTGPAAINANPQLAVLASNGGPTQTMAMSPTSPARNAAVGSTITADQRGFPVVVSPDIGAFELQAGGTFALSNGAYLGFEGGVAQIIINRTVNTNGTATVRLFTTIGTAGVTDFTGRPNTSVSDVVFLNNETSKVVEIPLTADDAAEAPGGETFTVTLGSPAPLPLATIGGPSTATVTINDSFMVNTFADEFNTPSGPSVSLREALRDAAAHAGADVIGFAPVLAGKTLTLGSEIIVNDGGGVTVDASSVGRVTISGGSATRLFTVSSPAVFGMRRVHLTGGVSVSGIGGAIFVGAGADVTLTQCALTANFAQTGGAIGNIYGLLKMQQCTVSGNNSGTFGGGIFTQTTLGSVTSGTQLDQCTLSGNEASRGGGIFNGEGTLTIKHCTIVGNTCAAPDGGGGVTGLASAGNTETKVEKSIIAGNSEGSVVFGFGPDNTFTSLGENVIGTGNATADFNQPGDVINDNPGVDALADNGGPTQTRALLGGSPALNAATGSAITSDQRGLGINGVPDIGAFEAQQGGRFALSATTYRTNEGSAAKVTIKRTLGFAGPATVRLITTIFTAGAADFTARPNTSVSDVSFLDGEGSKDVFIPTTPDALAEPANETFTVSLNTPTPVPPSTVGSPSSATVTIVDPLLVTNTNDDGPGSLRQVLAAAAANPGPDIVTFAPALNGKSVVLGSMILVGDPAGVTVDASNLPAGVTIDGGPDTNRIFSQDTGSTLTLKCLTLTGGNGEGVFSDAGGAIHNKGTLAVERCTFFGNSALEGGALYSDTGVTKLTQCTFWGNRANIGGAVRSENASMIIRQCTISGNTGTLLGGGISCFAVTGPLTLDRCIVAGNTSVQGADINHMGSPIQREGTSFVPELDNLSGVSGTGTILNTDPLLDTALANNGGPTMTVALKLNSPAINTGTGSTVASDQRGKPIADGLPDVGAFEAQTGGVFVMSQAGYSTSEGNDAVVTIKRTGGFLGTATVRLFTMNGTALARTSPSTPNDYDGRPNAVTSVVTFLNQVTSADVHIPTNGADGSGEFNESFTVVLGSPSAGASLGAPSSATVTIIDPSSATVADMVSPTVALSTPAVNALVNVDPGGNLTVTGTVTDNKGVQSVWLVLNNNAAVTATLDKPGATSTTFSRTFTNAVHGINTISATATDFAGHTSATVTRSFKVLRPLLVNISGLGSVTAGYAPKSYREVGAPQTITATPGTGELFAGWTVFSLYSLAQLGVSRVALEKPTVTFIHRDAIGQQPLALRANFVPNPFVASVVGTYNGSVDPGYSLLYPLPDVPAAIETRGYISMVVQSTGAFSGTLKIDGRTLNFAGTFDLLGVARFGTSRATTLTVLRGDKPAYTLSLTMDLGGNIFGHLTQPNGPLVVADSFVAAKRAFYSATNKVPTSPLLAANGGNGIYTTTFLVGDHHSVAAGQYPQGHGYATVTLTPTGNISLVGVLPDGTAITQSTTLSQANTWKLFVQLYPALQGFIAGDMGFNHGQPAYDFQDLNAVWFRPLQDTQHYALGWQDGLGMEIRGAEYVVTTGSSVVPLTQATGTGNGNADLIFHDGLLSGPLNKAVDISPADAVTEVPADADYTLFINRSTGVFSGTFKHSSGVMLPYTGISYQKAGIGGRGFFMSPTPLVPDYNGQGGKVELQPQ